jgi:hypothetical protein
MKIVVDGVVMQTFNAFLTRYTSVQHDNAIKIRCGHVRNEEYGTGRTKGDQPSFAIQWK